MRIVEIQIRNRIFELDTMLAEIRSPEDPLTTISFHQMIYNINAQRGVDTSFPISEQRANQHGYQLFANADRLGLLKLTEMTEEGLKLPHLVKLDPVGVAKKYGLTVSDLPKVDGGLRCKRELIADRLNGKLPEIEICGSLFHFDRDMMKLLPQDIVISQIDLSKLGKSDGKFYCYYDTECKTVVPPTENIATISENISLLIIPGLIHLDPVFEAKNYGLEDDSLVDRYPIQRLSGQTFKLNSIQLPKQVVSNRRGFDNQVKPVTKKRGRKI